MQIKTTTRYHFIPVRMAIFSKSTNKFWRYLFVEGMEKRGPSFTVGGNVNWYNPYGKQYGGSSETKYRTTGVSVMAQRKRIRLGTMRLWVQPLASLWAKDPALP